MKFSLKSKLCFFAASLLLALVVSFPATVNAANKIVDEEDGGGGGTFSEVTASLTASQTSITQGQSSTLTWSSTNSSSCTGGNFSTGNATSGSVTVTPGSTTTYSVNCTDAAGTLAVASRTVTVSAPVPTATLTASQTSITQGQSSTLTWSSTNSSSCTGTNFSTGNATSGSVTVTPGSTTTYSVTCNGSGGGTANASRSISVTEPVVTPVRYAIDWDMDGVVDELTPATGTVNTGISQTASHSWTTTGTKTFQARTEDSNGNVSSWVQHTIVISTPQCSDNIDNDGNGVKDYPADTGCTTTTDTTESGGSTPSVSCTVNPTSAAVGGSATYTATPSGGATGPYTWTASDSLSGLGTGSTATRTFGAMGTYGMTVRATAGNNPTATCPQVAVNSCTGTKTADINASPTRVNSGSTSVLSWNAQNITTSCVVSGPGVSQTIPAASCTVPTTSSFTTPAITTQSVYTITCDGTLLDSVIVNVIPKIEEF